MFVLLVIGESYHLIGSVNKINRCALWEMKMASFICDSEFVCTLLLLEVVLVYGDYGKSSDLFSQHLSEW